MKKYRINLPHIFYFFAVLAFLVYLSIAGKVILIPIVFSLFFALMLMPIVTFVQNKIRNRILSILIAFIVGGLPLIGILLFFVHQTRNLFNGLRPIGDKLDASALRIMDWFNNQFDLVPENSSKWLSENLMPYMKIPVDFLGESFQSGISFFVNAILIILITYFLLLYRTAFKNFILSQVPPVYRAQTGELLGRIVKLTERYMIGQGLVIIILALLIGSGLWFLGVPYPFFWGFLAGFLEIIPYLGTSIGVILPFTYMLIVAETLWQPWAVVVLYIIIQQIEGNLITPNIMGHSIKVNPLFIIMGLFLGGFMWGIPGMILTLPILAISKEFFRSFDELAPLSYLMEDGLSKKSDIFLDKFDNGKNRLFTLFFEEMEKGDQKK
jgi:predicted PurR-regulated permease PerM